MWAILLGKSSGTKVIETVPKPNDESGKDVISSPASEEQHNAKPGIAETNTVTDSSKVNGSPSLDANTLTTGVDTPEDEDDHTASDNVTPASNGPSLTNSDDAQPPSTQPNANGPQLSPPEVPRNRRFSFRSVGFFYGNGDDREAKLSRETEHAKRVQAKEAAKKAHIRLSKSELRAKETAVAVHAMIIGPSSLSAAAKVKPGSARQLEKIKAQLMQPKSAKLVISQLRQLPTPDGPSVANTKEGEVVMKTSGPIHFVCLEHPEAKIDELHFSKLKSDNVTVEAASEVVGVATASIDALSKLFDDMHVVNLLTTPDLGLGQGGDGEGILSGAVPTAETIINGIQQITPQLMALGYATGKTITPDHTGIYPPLDRVSVLTYWWGLEVAMPEPTMKYLSGATSITHTLINFLTALSLMNEGVREILPFIRYISQFMDFEWSSIQQQDRGTGVVCAATWIMPAAMVPRPWDFPDPPAKAPAPNPTPAAPTPSPVPPAAKPTPVSKRVPPPNHTTFDSGPTLIGPVMLPSLVVTPPTLASVPKMNT